MQTEENLQVSIMFQKAYLGLEGKMPCPAVSRRHRVTTHQAENVDNSLITMTNSSPRRVM